MKEYAGNVFRNAVQFKFKSVFVQSFLRCAAFFMFPILLMNVFFYILYTGSLDQEYNGENAAILARAARASDIIFAAAEKNAQILLSDKNLLYLMDTDIKRMDGKTLKNLCQSVEEKLSGVSVSTPYISSVYVYSFYNDFIVSPLGGTASEHFYDRGVIDLIRRAAESEERIFQRTIQTTPSQDEAALTLITPLYPNLKTAGAIVINLSLSAFSETAREALGETDGFLTVRGADGTALYVSAGDGGQNGGGSFSRYTSASETSPLRYEISISRADYARRYRNVIVMVAAFALVSLLIAALFSFFVTLSATRPLGFILDAVENPGKWADNQRLTKFGAENETKLALRNILNSFNLAENLKRQASIRAVLLKKAQAVVLQAQINPHFLFNTLESINLSVMELAGDDNQAVKMLDTLAELLRLSFQTRDILIPLSDELRMARKYASILQFRYFSLLDVAWDIDPALLNFCVVKFSLQPLIENALDHGIKPLGKKGTITVSVREDGGNILLSVADDGVGVAPQTLEALRKRLADADVAGGEGIGVGNVHRRARLTFGEAYGVSVTSRAGRTEFTITIPKIPIG